MGRGLTFWTTCLLLISALEEARGQRDPALHSSSGSGTLALLGSSGVNAVDFVPGTGSCGGNSLQSVGYEFDVTSPVTVTAMAWFDDGLDGLTVSHEVAIWDPSGAVVSGTHVTIPAGTGAALDGIWRVVPIPPTTLSPATGYIVGGMNGQVGECLTSNIAQTVHPDLTYVDPTYGSGPPFNRPVSHSSATEGFYGPSFQIGGVPPGAYCFGDGSGTPCPCGNEAGVGEGCLNTTNLGATLTPSGSAGVAADDLVFQAHQLVPGQPGLLFAGTIAVNGGAGSMFGDGLRCAGIGAVRLGISAASAGGEATWGPGLATLGGWSAGDISRFQVWYRDPGNSVCGSGFNLTHGVEVTWVP